MLKISQSVEKAVSEAEDYFGTLSNGNTVSCTDIITLADKEEVKKIAEKNDCDVKIGEFSVVFFDKGEVAENFKEMVGQSRKPIKSGTSNFGRNDNIFGYNFPLVTYTAENYVYDEENDVETEERDYDADDYEYEGAMEDAENLADEMDIPMYKDYSEPYLCHEPFMIEIENGYYDGIYIKIREGTDEEDAYKNDEYGSYYDGGRPFTDEEMKKFADKINTYLDKLCSDYGWSKVGVTARFDNGETLYHKINNSRKSIKSMLSHGDETTIEILKDGHWEFVSFDKTPEGWSTGGRAAQFGTEDKARKSTLVKRLADAGYSEKNGNLKFSHYNQ